MILTYRSVGLGFSLFIEHHSVEFSVVDGWL